MTLILVIVSACIAGALAFGRIRVHRIEEKVRLRAFNNQASNRIAEALRPVLIDLDLARRETDRLSQAAILQDAYLRELNGALRRGLTDLAGGADGLLEGSRARELTPDQAARIGRLSDRAAGLLAVLDRVNDLPELTSRTLHVRPEKLDPRWIARDVLTALQAQASDAGVTLTFDKPGAGLSAVADPVRLRQVLVNLVAWAIHDSAPESEVRISFETREQDVLVVIAAPGVALAERRIASLFHPAPEALTDFHIIGVSVCRSVAEAMGATLCAGRDDEGALRLELSLPAGIDRDVAGSGIAPVREAVVLLVTSQDGAGAALRREVRRLGGQLYVCPPDDGPLATARDLRPDLVLIDADDPGLDAFRLRAQLAACRLCAALPVVGLTARRAPEDERRARQAGFAAWTPWPIQAGAVSWMLATALDAAAERKAA